MPPMYAKSSGSISGVSNGSRFLVEKITCTMRLTRVCAMIVPFLFDPFRVAIRFLDSNPVALPPAIEFVRCADVARPSRATASSPPMINCAPSIGGYDMNRSAKSRLALVIFSIALLTTTARAQYKPESFSAMKWRLVGPHRGGRVTTVAGIPGKPAIYYFGTPGGGVWKTTDGGRVWKPIFDDAHVASIGAIVLAPSNPDIVYVGTGQETEGNGVYKSTDGGATWARIPLRDTHYISSIVVDPRNPDIVLVAARDYSVPSPARGVFKTTDGGKTWNRALFKDDKTSVVDMCAAPDDPSIVYAATYALQIDPNNRRALGSDSQIYKSTDQGATW